ncbi:protein of unknown function [Kyrpidia spormannii]|uniref:Uncharacterized protein n=2 Tax=Kyrpidia spormannii TaxID=2055160 RepID=A0ACA8ZAK4_9BACL|nr:protein of unknown function [Kyrpidia spormannii]CAB3394415.1 protein of unknown function [Kyrpidia spormannii]
MRAGARLDKAEPRDMKRLRQNSNIGRSRVFRKEDGSPVRLPFLGTGGREIHGVVDRAHSLCLSVCPYRDADYGSSGDWQAVHL